MPLKFPTTKSPFAQVELTEADCRLYEARAETLVRNALAEYDNYCVAKHRKLDRKLWKPVKTRENLTVHCARRSGSDDAATRRAPKPPQSALTLGASKISGWLSNADKANSDWSLPPLLAVGSIPGTLDDVMFGIAAFDSAAMFLKSSYTDNELADGEVLYSIKTPTPEAPYDFVGLKWIVKAQATGMNAIVWPRDVVYLESTGILTRSDGERIGYQLMHSVDVPVYKDLRDQGVLRATMSSCFLFKQLPKGAVDVYMKAHVEPNGKVAHAIAIKSTAASLIYCWKAVSCSQHKKLAWELALKERGQHAPASQPTDSKLVRRGSQLSSCSLCSKAIGAFRHAVKCALCDEPVCSKCHVVKKLGYKGAWAKHVQQRAVAACTSCIAAANQTDAFHIAREQLAATSWEDVSNDALSRSLRKHSRETERHSSERTTAAWQSDRSTETLGSSPEMGACGDVDRKPRLSRSFSIAASVAESHAEMDQSERDAALDAAAAASPSSVSLGAGEQSHSQKPQMSPSLTHEQRLWLQMAELRNQAESVYQYTKRSGESHLASTGSAARSLDLVELLD